jgi:hypothetical protein
MKQVKKVVRSNRPIVCRRLLHRCAKMFSFDYFICRQRASAQVGQKRRVPLDKNRKNQVGATTVPLAVIVVSTEVDDS